MVIPVRGLLTATIPSLPPDKIISPVVKEENGIILIEESDVMGRQSPKTSERLGTSERRAG